MTSRRKKLKLRLDRTKFSPISLTLLVLTFFYCYSVFCQTSSVSLDYAFESSLEPLIYNRSNKIHTSIRPFLRSDFNDIFNCDSVYAQQRSVFSKISEEKQHPNFNVNLLSLASGGHNFSDSSHRISEGGIGVGAEFFLSKSLFINASYFSSGAVVPDYFADYIDNANVVPGEGWAYYYNKRYNSHKFTGLLSYSLNRLFTFQIGHGKHFFGDGYRSLLLSDAANNYSFAKLSTDVGKIKYVNLFTALKDYRSSPIGYQKTPNKYAAMHYLSMYFTEWINLSIFESVVWGGKDTLNQRNFDVNYLNPIVFYRPVEYAVGSADNSILGMNLKVSPFKKTHLYGQLVLDEFLLDSLRSANGWWANKYGYQIGVKSVDFLLPKLTLQAEYNTVRPFTYSHKRTAENYGHQNMSLAHPLGANFKEYVGIVRYNHKNWYTQLKITQATFGVDSGVVNYGGNIFKNYNTRTHETGNYTGQGVSNKLITAQWRIGYVLHPASNLTVETEIGYRKSLNELIGENKNTFITIGLRTNLGNRYTDFF